MDTKQEITIISPFVIIEMMDLYFAFLAHKTGTIWWTMIAHALGGLIMVV